MDAAMVDHSSLVFKGVAQKYRSTWLFVAIGPCAFFACCAWILPIAVQIWIDPFLGRSGHYWGSESREQTYFWLMFAHAASLIVMPSLAWSAARRAVLRFALPAKRRWLLSGPSPRWAIMPILF